MVLIATKRTLKLLSLVELLKFNNLDYYKLDPLGIEINGKQVIDTAILIDIEARVYHVYKKEAGQKAAIMKQENIIGISNYYRQSHKEKKYGR